MDLLRAIGRPLLAGFFALAFGLQAPAQEEIDSKVRVRGFGLFGNADLRRSLDLLEIGDGPISRQKIDDGAFLILSRLKQSGYLQAELHAEVVTVDDQTQRFTWSGDFVPQIESPLQARLVEYRIEEGQLYYIEDVRFEGLSFMTPDEAREYFIPDAALITTKRARSYSPSILSNAKRNFLGSLVAQGFGEAEISSEQIDIDESTGAVRISLSVNEGPRYHVAEARILIHENDTLIEERQLQQEAIYSRFWVEDETRALRNESYQKGFPDTRVTSRITQSLPEGDRKNISVQFEVRRGRQQMLAGVEHRGATDTKQTLLERRASLQPGKPLDITEVEKARRELSRGGLFSRVDLSYEQVAPNQRQVVFNYTNANRIQGQLLVGYGSYEQFRAGLLGRRTNLFGRAHTATFEAIQSLKSTRGTMTYRVPELLGESIDGNFDLQYLDRQEPSFDRKERGARVGLSTYLRELETNLALDYAFELKEAENVTSPEDFRVEPTNIGSLSLRASRTKLDNVLYPTAGYEISSAVRYAARALGGETEFTRIESGANYHGKLNNRWIYHLSGRGGIVSSPGDNRSIIPFGERFLVGGENTLRGFQRGEAGPRAENGQVLGAEAFLLLNAEAEYPLLEKLNAVFFVDAARVWDSSGRLDDYGDFVSIGIGLRYQTFVGPVRLEYGRNVDPRPADPEGTLHISVGFPF